MRKINSRTRKKRSPSKQQSITLNKNTLNELVQLRNFGFTSSRQIYSSLNGSKESIELLKFTHKKRKYYFGVFDETTYSKFKLVPKKKIHPLACDEEMLIAFKPWDERWFSESNKLKVMIRLKAVNNLDAIEEIESCRKIYDSESD